jgi:hypothetical protein
MYEQMEFTFAKFHLFLLKKKEYSANMVQAIFLKKTKQRQLAVLPTANYKIY